MEHALVQTGMCQSASSNCHLPACHTRTPHNALSSRFHTVRKGSQTEQTTKGRKASSQLDKLQGLLKDSPQKHSLKVHSGSTEAPPLSTLHSFGLSGKKDSNIAGDRGVGFLPAGLVKGSLKVDRNVIPIASND